MTSLTFSVIFLVLDVFDSFLNLNRKPSIDCSEPGQNLSQCYQPDLFRKSTENSNGTIDEDTASEISKVSPFQPSFFIRFVLRAYSWPRLRRWKFNGAFNGYSVGARLGRKRLKEEKTARLSPPPEFCPIARSARASTCVPSPSDRKGFYRYEFNFRTNSQPPRPLDEPSRAEPSRLRAQRGRVLRGVRVAHARVACRVPPGYP